MIEKIVDRIKKMNKIAMQNNDIPVSCIITKNNKIIASAYNQKYKKCNPIDHAEIIAIKKACKKLKTTNLMDCNLYVSLYPCKMCQGAIEEVRIKHVYYILEKTKEINNNISYEHMCVNDKNDFCKEIQDFFKDKR